MTASALITSHTGLISITKLRTPHVGERIGCRRYREAGLTVQEPGMAQIAGLNRLCCGLFSENNSHKHRTS